LDADEVDNTGLWEKRVAEDMRAKEGKKRRIHGADGHFKDRFKAEGSFSGQGGH